MQKAKLDAWGEGRSAGAPQFGLRHGIAAAMAHFGDLPEDPEV